MAFGIKPSDSRMVADAPSLVFSLACYRGVISKRSDRLPDKLNNIRLIPSPPPPPPIRFISRPLADSSLLFIVIKCAFTQITSRRANFPTASGPRVFYVIFINNERVQLTCLANWVIILFVQRYTRRYYRRLSFTFLCLAPPMGGYCFPFTATWRPQQGSLLF